jgi:hypothetical protein
MRRRRRDAGIPRKHKEFEDEIIAAKLNRGNEEERRALEWWDYWLSQVDEAGQPLSKRRLLTWITLRAAGEEAPTAASGVSISDVIQQFQRQLDQLADTVAQLQEMGVAPSSVKKKSGSRKPSKVDTSYLANLMKAFQGDEE